MIYIETDRLLFRTHEPKDQLDFVQMHTDPEVRRYMGGQPWPLEKALQRFREQYLDKPAGTFGLWATILKSENKYIGCCGLRAVEDRTTPHLGCLLAQPYWRRGLASEAANAFISIAFTRLALPRLLADVEKGNAASEHILEKLGFRRVSEEEATGSGRVILLYELQRAVWEQRNM